VSRVQVVFFRCNFCRELFHHEIVEGDTSESVRLDLKAQLDSHLDFHVEELIDDLGELGNGTES